MSGAPAFAVPLLRDGAENRLERYFGERQIVVVMKEDTAQNQVQGWRWMSH